jgi:hypothetical protein
MFRAISDFGVRVMKFDACGSTAESENPSVCWGSRSGASRTRTGGLLGAIQALSQLSYSPVGALMVAAHSMLGGWRCDRGRCCGDAFSPPR